MAIHIRLLIGSNEKSIQSEKTIFDVEKTKLINFLLLTEKVTNSEVELVTSLPDMVVKLTVTAAERQKYEIEAEMARMAEEEDIMSPLKGNHSHYRTGICGQFRPHYDRRHLDKFHFRWLKI